jgi:hypothetical protein
VLADGKRGFYLNEGIVKAAKDLVTNIQAAKSVAGKKVTNKFKHLKRKIPCLFLFL